MPMRALTDTIGITDTAITRTTITRTAVTGTVTIDTKPTVRCAPNSRGRQNQKHGRGRPLPPAGGSSGTISAEIADIMGDG